MKAAVVSLQDSLRETAFVRCRDVIAAGGVIAYPTDTIYGLGVDPRNLAAINRLFSVKGRSAEQPILLLLPDAGEVARWAVNISTTAQKLMQRYWPGPLTLVFRARSDVPAELTAGTGTIGLRVPGSDLSRLLLRSIGTALTGTSANKSGEPGGRTAAEVLAALGDSLDLVIDGGPAVEDKPSTVVDVSSVRPVLIRGGALEIDLDRFA